MTATHSFLVAICLFLSIINGQESVTVNILSDKIIHTTQDFFVSYTLDISNFFDGGLNLSSSQLQYMGQQLSPAVLRVGGGQADKTYYFNTASGDCQPKPPSGYSCFTKDDLQELMNYVSATKAKLVFGLSTGYPTYPNKNTKEWNSSNTETFLNYIVDNGYGENFYGFELGNEINTDVQVSFQIDAFKKLRTILQQIYGGKNLNIPLLMGPDPHSYTLRYFLYTKFMKHISDTKNIMILLYPEQVEVHGNGYSNLLQMHVMELLMHLLIIVMLILIRQIF